MRPERLYLTDMVDAADAIGRFVTGVGYDDFVRDELRQSAVLQKLVVMGDAADGADGCCHVLPGRPGKIREYEPG